MSAAPQAPPALIPPTTALASIATWSLSAVLCVTLLALHIGPQAFPRTHRSRFIASDSSLRYVRIRAGLLFTLALVNLLDALNSVTHFVLAWQFQTYHVLAHRLVFACTFSAIPPLSVLCLSYRCAVIVVADSDKRTRYVRWSRVACLCAWMLHATGVVYQAIAIMADSVPTSEQIASRWVPLWATAGSALIPLIAVGGSVWSLRMVRPPTSQMQSRGQSGSNRSSATTTTTTGSKRPPDSLVPAITLASSSMMDPTSGGPVDIRQVVLPLAPSASATATQPPSIQRPPARINYPLTETFRVLTYSIFFTWLASGLLAVVPMVGPIRNNALLNLIMTCTIALESSFERLLKLHHRQRKGVRRRVENADASTMGGNGNGDMVGESVLDIGGNQDAGSKGGGIDIF